MNDMPSKYFFRQRMKNRIYDAVIVAVEDAAAMRGMRKKDIAEKLGVNPSQVTRWLSGPANWGTDTISDLLFAVDAELEPIVVTFADRQRQKSNRFHPLEIALGASEHLAATRNETAAAVVPVSSSGAHAASTAPAGRSIGDTSGGLNLPSLASPQGNQWAMAAAPMGLTQAVRT